MSEQLELPPAIHVGPPGDQTIAQAFATFHAENPDVYWTLRRLALDWKRRGGTRCGIKMLFERARWELPLTTDGEPFKLNNNYTSYYARLLEEREPELRGLFRMRRLHGPEGIHAEPMAA